MKYSNCKKCNKYIRLLLYWNKRENVIKSSRIYKSYLKHKLFNHNDIPISNNLEMINNE